ncbi:MAG: hypothetical protein NVSMB55_22810 [Mycobacteriales bacterium]
MAEAGNIPAVRQALKISVEARVQGLLDGAESAGAASVTCGPSTVVISAADCRHGRCAVHGTFNDQL